MEEIDKLALLSRTLYNERIVEQRKEIEKLKKEKEIEHKRLIESIWGNIFEKCSNRNSDGYESLLLHIQEEKGSYIIEEFDSGDCSIDLSRGEVDEVFELLKTKDGFKFTITEEIDSYDPFKGKFFRVFFDHVFDY